MVEHKIRYATKSDFEGVMSIGKVYHGTDYLPHFYNSFIEDPNARSYVYLIQDKVVAFCSDVLVDDGHTLLLRAGRVRNDYRDQGIYGQLLKHVYDEYSQMEGVDFEVMTTNTLIYEARKDRLLQQYSEHYTKVIVSAPFHVSDIDVVAGSSTVPSPGVLTDEDLSLLFVTEGNRGDLFPGGRLIVDWCPYKSLASNMKYIIRPGSLALRTKDKDQSTRLLSISTSIPCEIGLKYIVDIFGNDMSHLEDHLILQLKNVKSLTDGKVFFQVITIEKYRKETEQTLEKLKLCLCDFPIHSIHYFGRKFP